MDASFLVFSIPSFSIKLSQEKTVGDEVHGSDRGIERQVSKGQMIIPPKLIENYQCN